MTDKERSKVAAYRLRRASDALEEARLMADAEHWNACVNRLYYACFYAVSALLVAHDLTPQTHDGTRRLFGKHFVRDGPVAREQAALYSNLFQRRQQSDYKDFVDFEPTQVRPWIEETKAFLDTVAPLVRERVSDDTA